MGHLAAFVLVLLVALLLGGLPLVRKFLRGLFAGARNDVYVFLTIDGQTVCYKNPNSPHVHEDEPLLMVPYEILESSEYDTYYNVCWFDAGVPFRCEHSFHRKPENALYCKKINIEGVLIGKVLEQR